MHQSFVEFWEKHACPNCDSINWTYHSHSQRQEPIHSPSICKCWSCGKEYWLMSEEDQLKSHLEIDDVDIGDGIRNPGE